MKSSNLKYLFKEWKDVGKSGMIQAFLRIPVELLLPTLMALIPKLIIDAINNKVSDASMLILIGLITVFLVLLSVLQPSLIGKMNKTSFQYMLHFNMIGLKKMLNINYQTLESFEGRRKCERASAFSGLNTTSHLNAGSFIWLSSDIIISISGIGSYLILFTILQPYLVIILIISCVLEFFILRQMSSEYVRFYDNASSIFTKTKYFYRVATESKAGKDIRLYNLSDKFCYILAKLAAQTAALNNRLFKKNTQLTFGQAFTIMIRDIASYGFLISLALSEKMSLSNFILYFGLLVGFSGWVSGLAFNINEMKKLDIECGRFREFIDNEEDGIDLPLPFKNKVESIEFDNVSFTYEQAEEATLKNISFKISINDRLGIVGENGAGKTTLIKLLCGLYKPTSGQILINGMPVNEFIGKNYFELFATVFQDFYFLPLSVMENVSMQTIEKTDENKVIACLQKAGMLDKINGLPLKMQSKMIRQVWEDAVDFSGGEQQRLLLARALYKDAPILILDEPTSALDPLAEQNIYLRYKEVSEDKISIFISHRLASTQFCNKLFYMSNGEITESGTHDELLALKGRYYGMFEAQSYYYKNSAKTEEHDCE